VGSIGVFDNGGASISASVCGRKNFHLRGSINELIDSHLRGDCCIASERTLKPNALGFWVKVWCPNSLV